MKTSHQFVYLIPIKREAGRDLFLGLKGPNNAVTLAGGHTNLPRAKDAVQSVAEVLQVSDIRSLQRRTDNDRAYVYFYVTQDVVDGPAGSAWYPLDNPPALTSRGWKHDHLLTEAIQYAREVLDVVLRPKLVKKKRTNADPLAGLSKEIKDKSKKFLGEPQRFQYGSKAQRTNSN